MLMPWAELAMHDNVKEKDSVEMLWHWVIPVALAEDQGVVFLGMNFEPLAQVEVVEELNHFESLADFVVLEVVIFGMNFLELVAWMELPWIQFVVFLQGDSHVSVEEKTEEEAEGGSSFLLDTKDCIQLAASTNMDVTDLDPCFTISFGCARSNELAVSSISNKGEEGLTLLSSASSVQVAVPLPSSSCLPAPCLIDIQPACNCLPYPSSICSSSTSSMSSSVSSSALTSPPTSCCL